MAEAQRRSDNGSLTSRHQNSLVFSKTDDFATPATNYGLIMKRLKPFAGASLINGGSASSWRSTTNFDESRPWMV